MKQIFEQQLNLLNIPNYDCLIVKYDTDYLNSQNYLNKNIFLNLSKEELLSNYEHYNSLNNDNYNIYIRDSNFLQSPFITIDDIYINTNIQRSIDSFVRSFSLSHIVTPYLYILTSEINNNQNYQIIFKLNPDIPIEFKDSILKKLIEKFKADKRHGHINKFFRAAGFINKKPLDYSYISSKEFKNQLITLKEPISYAKKPSYPLR